MVLQHEPVEAQLRKQKYIQRLAAKQEVVKKPAESQGGALQALLEELYEVRAKIRAHGKLGKGPEKRALLVRKNELIFQIQKALDNVSKGEAGRVRKNLYADLGIVIG